MAHRFAVRAVLLMAMATSSLAMASCVTRITTRSVFQESSTKVAKKDLFDATCAVLINNGFELTVANEHLALINTAYRNMTSSSETALAIVGAVTSALANGPAQFTHYSTSLMLSVQITDLGYRVVPKVKRNTHTTSFFKADDEANYFYPDQYSPEGKLVMKIIEEINQSTGLNGIPSHWEERDVEAQ